MQVQVSTKKLKLCVTAKRGQVHTHTQYRWLHKLANISAHTHTCTYVYYTDNLHHSKIIYGLMMLQSCILMTLLTVTVSSGTLERTRWMVVTGEVPSLAGSLGTYKTSPWHWTLLGKGCEGTTPHQCLTGNGGLALVQHSLLWVVKRWISNSCRSVGALVLRHSDTRSLWRREEWTVMKRTA